MKITIDINLVRLFSPNLLHEMDNVQFKIVSYILYGNDKPIRKIYDTSIQLVRTCLILNCTQNKKKISNRPALLLSK